MYLCECATHSPTTWQLEKEQLRRNKPDRERWRDILLQNLMTHVITIWYDSFPKKAPLMSQIAQFQSALINVQWVRRQREVRDSRDSLVFFSLQVVQSKLCGVFGLCCSMNPSPQRCTPEGCRLSGWSQFCSVPSRGGETVPDLNVSLFACLHTPSCLCHTFLT